MLCVPLLWYGGYQYFDSVLKTANGVRRYEEHGIIPIYENSKNIMNADLEFLTLENLPEDFVKALKAKCKRKHAKNDEKILINITSFTRNALEYEIIIPNKDQKYSNHRGFVPNIFGTLKDGVTEPSFHLGTSISEYTEASKAQMCVDSVYLSWTKVDSMNLTIYAKKIGDVLASDLGLLLTYELNFVRTAYPLLLVVSLMLSTIELCKEKENQIPTYLMTMGNHRIFFYLSHWLFMLFKTWLFIVPAGFAVAIYFWRSGIGLIACVLIVLMAHVLIGVCLFASTLFKDSNYVSYSIIALYSASYVVHMFLSDYVTVFDFYGALIISTFNPYSAYAYAFDHLFIVLQFDQEMRYFEDSEYYLPLTFPIVMLTIQSIIYTLLAFYLDLVLPIDDSPKIHPLFFLGFRKKSSPLTNEKIELCRGIVIPPDEDSANIEEQEEENYGQFGAYIETEPSARNPVVNVHRLIKKWNKSDIALKGISFKIYKGQITVLLGHNGSGKTTLFNCLTGLTNPTGGLIRIYGVPPKTYGHEKRISF
uniref:ABC transporter domain-containing protein n=1 Tax=Panagrolaimus sp. JU765 TaxID=591449 RepID=A0AC34R2Q4_9BILA